MMDSKGRMPNNARVIEFDVLSGSPEVAGEIFSGIFPDCQYLAF